MSYQSLTGMSFQPHPSDVGCPVSALIGVVALSDSLRLAIAVPAVFVNYYVLFWYTTL